MRIRHISPVLLLLLAILACSLVEPAPNQPAEVASETAIVAGENSLPKGEAPETEESTFGAGTPGAPFQEIPPTGAVEAPPVAEKPPQSQAAEIRPPERRQELTRLTSLLGFQVTDRSGGSLGVISDFVINTCETYIIYIVLDPADTLGLAPESRLFIPYEAVTINSGALDAQSKALVLYLVPDQLRNAPLFPAAMELIPTDWEAGVRAFFSQTMRLSNLTTECHVAAPGTDSSGGTVAIHKITYATELLGAELRDGLQNSLGRVEEAILAPESGKLSFFVVSLQDQQAFVLVPLRVVNIPKQALGPENEISLVLLTENELLLNAPRIGTVEEAAQVRAQNTARQYWNR